ncbi:hypothetical protein [Mesorhizobium sp. M8A.F.Ca.ET.021.01.1.1]|uniref:hypothetical protein n=1 Tax=Mesorhizobium sp. M8A.F.Ca.ET.021.01.1.1 TaxID=2496757 RepID=UPI000FC9C2BE|nr:hypothetical protein [Mesorhizobium sp. M8A.F.Ca.ET.021.01.1.1]RUW56722.1 hypothetical protein EOA36_02745 [Mesorhizobium sp. M8A.F.Ca.ET.021.01.1.1]
MHTPRFNDSIKGATLASNDLAAASNMLGEFSKLLRDALQYRSVFPMLAKQIDYTLETAAKHGFIPHPAPDYSKLAALIAGRETTPPSISVKTIMEKLAQPEAPRPNTGILPPGSNVGQGPRHTRQTGYESHRTRPSDSSYYDEKCVLCGVTDRRGMAELNKSCSASQADRDAYDAKQTAAAADRQKLKEEAMADYRADAIAKFPTILGKLAESESKEHPIEDAFDAGRELAIERAEKAAAQQAVAVDKLKIVNTIVMRLRGDRRLPHVPNDQQWASLKPLRERLADLLLADIDKAVQAVRRPTHQNWFAGRVLQSVSPAERDGAWLRITSTDVRDMVRWAFDQVVSEMKDGNA